MEKEFDAAVVGGGIGGFGVAAQLQKRGLKTILVDEHSRIGGRSTSMRFMEDWLIDMGHHGINLAEKSQINELVELVGKKIPWAKPIVGVQVYRKGKWNNFLEAFELDKSDLEEIEIITKTVKKMSDEEINSLDDTSFRDWILQYTESDNLLELYRTIGMGYTTIPDMESQAASEAVWLYRENIEKMGEFSERPGGVPVGGAINLVTPLEEAFTENGGIVKLRTRAKEVLIKDQKAVGIRVQEREGEEYTIKAKLVVCAIPINRFPEILFTEENLSQLEGPWVRRMESVKDQVSASIGYIAGLSKPLYSETSFKCSPELPHSKTAFQVFAQSNCDETVAPKGKMLISMGAAAKKSQVLDENNRKNLLELIWTDIEEVFPGIAEIVEWNIPGFFIGPDGLERKPGLVGKHRPDIKAPGVEGLYFAGDNYRGRGVGVNNAARSAMICADKILKDMK
ncbi:MAG: phytoene desaturase family protein [Candidatus Lokiarchaeia archaeon]